MTIKQFKRIINSRTPKPIAVFCSPRLMRWFQYELLSHKKEGKRWMHAVFNQTTLNPDVWNMPVVCSLAIKKRGFPLEAYIVHELPENTCLVLYKNLKTQKYKIEFI